MHIPMASLVSFAVAVAFAAGLNVYATVGTLGLLARTGLVALPPGLEPLTHTWVIALAAVLFLAEFVADKIPVLDVFWSAAHTLVRVPVAALLAWRASAPLSPELQVLVAATAALVTLLVHGGKTGVRVGATASPEPFSNIALSSAEDAGAVGLTWLATKHPVLAGISAVALVGAGALAVRWMWTGMQRGWQRMRGQMPAAAEASFAGGGQIVDGQVVEAAPVYRAEARALPAAAKST